MTERRLRIAWFTDLAKDGVESVSAYTSRLLLPELLKTHSIEVFSSTTSSEQFSLPHYHYLTAYQRHRVEPFDLFFYQVEDGASSRFVRGHIGLVPGVVWVHDLFCRDLGPEACHTSPWEHSIKQFYDPSLPFADRSIAPHQLWPRLYREISLCPVVLFSSDWAHREFSRMTSNRLEAEEGGHHAEVLQVPVSFDGRTPGHAKGEVFTIACASVTGIEGRSHKVLPALRRLEGAWKLIWMVDHDEQAAAEALAFEYGLSPERYEVRSPRSPELWGSIVQEADCALHVHTSVFGHLAPYMQISLANRCPVIVAQSGQGEDIPDTVAFHIIPGTHESSQLIEIFRVLQGKDALNFGVHGHEYVRQHCDPRLVAQQLCGIFQSRAPQVSYVMDRWDSLRKRAQKALVDEVRELVNGEAVISSVDPFERVISPAIRDLGW